MHWYLAAVKKYAVISGRACRKEYWMFNLFHGLFSIALTIVDVFADSDGMLSILYGLAMLLPVFGVSIRRLHDTNRSGWWLLLYLLPILGWIPLTIFVAQDSQPGDNQYGGNPNDDIVVEAV